MPDGLPSRAQPQARLEASRPAQRALPDHASLRFLRIEAKRRLAAGEFPTLHDAQSAIAREHGLPTWAALKERVQSQQEVPARGEVAESLALAHLRWVMDRFSSADQPGWTAPGADEFAAHFDPQVLAVVPPAALIAEFARLAPDLRAELTILGQSPLEVQVQLAGLRYFAVAAADPPHLLTGLRGYPLAERISDPRTKQPPPARTSGQPPGQVAAIAGDAFAELGLPALVLAGGQPGRAPWVLAQGHADLDTDDQLDPGHLLPAPGVTALVTATAVLALVAEGRVGLDDPVNRHLRSVRLASPAVTLRDLLSHRGGVDEPEQVYAGQVPTLAGLMGPVIGCHGPRGTVNPSNAGYQVLGQLVADVTRLAFAEAARRLVLSPLGMRASVFPHSAAELARDDIARCYTVTRELAFAPSPPQVPVLQAVAGLWSTGADLVRLGTGWPSLLPAELARAALTDQARADQARADQARADQARAGQAPVGRPEPQTHPPVGLGWLLDPDGRTAVHAGGMPDAGALLRVRLRDLRTHVILTTRQIAIAATDERLTQVWTDPDQPTGGTTP